MALSQNWNEIVNGATTNHTIIIDDPGVAQFDAVNARIAERFAAANGAMLTQQLMAVGIPQYVPPAAYAVMPDDSVLTVGPGGEVYKDAVRLGSAKVSKLVQIGTSVYGAGKTDGKWYRWTGTGWVVVTDFDASILK
jgi:hypothetical protein